MENNAPKTLKAEKDKYWDKNGQERQGIYFVADVFLSQGKLN